MRCHFWNIQILIALHLEGLESLLDMEMLWSLKYWEKQYHFINIYPGTEILGSLKKYFAHLWCHFHFSLLFKIFFQQKFDRMKRYRKSHKTRSKIIDLAQKFCTLVVQKEIIVVKNTRLNKFSFTYGAIFANLQREFDDAIYCSTSTLWEYCCSNVALSIIYSEFQFCSVGQCLLQRHPLVTAPMKKFGKAALSMWTMPLEVLLQ